MMNDLTNFKKELSKILSIRDVAIDSEVLFSVFADGGFIYSSIFGDSQLTFDVITSSSDPMFSNISIKDLLEIEDISYLSFTISSAPDGNVEFRLEYKKDNSDSFENNLARLYRVEFNEKQQGFHLDSFNHEPNTHGWHTIFESCSDLEFKVFESFVNCRNNKRLTLPYVLKCASEVEKFTNNLLEYKLQVSVMS